MSDTDDAKLVEELLGISDDEMISQAPAATMDKLHRAAATIERLRAELDAEREQRLELQNLCQARVVRDGNAITAAESALSTARSTAFREAADTPPGVKSLIFTADDCDRAGMTNSESACVLVGWLRELRTAVAALDAKAKEDTQP